MDTTTKVTLTVEVANDTYTNLKCLVGSDDECIADYLSGVLRQRIRSEGFQNVLKFLVFMGEK